jgi:hypothetical protein
MAAKTRTRSAKQEKAAGAGAAGATDRCELCRARLPDRFTARLGHLWTVHPRYAQGLLLRLATPLVFLAVLGALAAASAPSWAYLAALGLCGGLMVTGMLASRSGRTHAGLRPTVPLGQLLRDGGFRFLLLPALLLLLLLLSRN